MVCVHILLLPLPEQEQLLVLPQLAYLPVSIVFVVIVVVGTLL